MKERKNEITTSNKRKEIRNKSERKILTIK